MSGKIQLAAAVAPTAALLQGPSQDLGSFAAAVENAPIATLTVAAGLVGALWGGLAGLTAAALLKKEKSSWAAVGAGLGAAILGAKGYADGQELDQWLKQYK